MVNIDSVSSHSYMGTALRHHDAYDQEALHYGVAQQEQDEKSRRRRCAIRRMKPVFTRAARHAACQEEARSIVGRNQ